MRVLKQGMSGPDVEAWQMFLVGQGWYWVVASGTFDEETASCTGFFQGEHSLGNDGVVGPKTLQAARALGFTYEEQVDTSFPAKPDWTPLTAAERIAAFGTFTFVPNPTAANPEGIRITSDWAQKNVVVVDIPQLREVQGAPQGGKVLFHRKGAEQLRSLWAAWEAQGLLPQVRTFDGTWAPRFVRGSRSTLSNHAYATAFDVNARWNALGAKPAPKGKAGSVLELVPLAHEHGFEWGGHFARVDGMHFQLGKLL